MRLGLALPRAPAAMGRCQGALHSAVSLEQVQPEWEILGLAPARSSSLFGEQSVSLQQPL
jgi:hypothetical protein